VVVVMIHPSPLLPPPPPTAAMLAMQHAPWTCHPVGPREGGRQQESRPVRGHWAAAGELGAAPDFRQKDFRVLFPLPLFLPAWSSSQHLASGTWHLAPGTWHIAHRKSSVTLCLPASNLGSGPKAKIAICSPLTLPLLPGPGCACRSLTIVPSVPDVPDWGMQAHTHKLPKSWECGRLLERWMSSSRLV
jgi:hypothetical protein